MFIILLCAYVITSTSAYKLPLTNHTRIQLLTRHALIRHIVWVDKPFRRVLFYAPPMYDELWTRGKAMYKLEPVLAEWQYREEGILYVPKVGKMLYRVQP